MQYRRFKKLPQDKRNIVFYSESRQDWHHLEPLITYLSNTLSRTVCYVTSDPNDTGLYQNNSNLLGFYIKEGFLQITFFQFLKADVLVLTMEDLQVFQLKRSINPVHYIFIFHAMGSTHMVNLENSYDHYDTLFCVGEHQKKEIRKREELKQLPSKNLFDYGYSRLDALISENEQRKVNNAVNETLVILIAPTWGDNSILNVCGEQLVKVLLDAGYKVILRPHYQTVKLTPEIVNTILNKYGKHQNFSYVTLMGDTESLFESDLLICDWSSTSIEYGLGLEKPVLYIDVPRRVRNPDYHELEIEPMEVTIRNEIGAILEPSRLDRAPDVINDLLADPRQFKNKIVELRKRLVFNLGKSAETGAKEIARIADRKAGERKEAGR
jgi:YidC/Oxa1 family membrane protein insertase